MLAHILTPSAALAILLSTALPTFAGERKFDYNYEVTTSPKGSVEIENTVTWLRRPLESGYGNQFAFRHEVEIGVTDHFQLGLYVADWSYNDSVEGKRLRYDHSGFEAIYNLTNPTTDWLGSALYLEVVGAKDLLQIETKLLLQKNIGPVTVAYNAILESSWSGVHLADERRGEFAETLGVSAEVNRHFSVGAEVLHEVDIPDWSKAGDSIVFAGPNASVRFGRAYVTAACLFQLTGIAGEPDLQTRVIFGVEF